jgi:hypothetical protein
MQALEPVRVRDCACPNTPHAKEGDIIYISPTLPLRGGLVANRQAIARAKEVAAGLSNNLQDDWVETFVRYGALGWNLLDEDGDPVPFEVEAILADYMIATVVSEKANDLGYGDAAMAPFLRSGLTKSKPAGKKRPRRSGSGRTPATTSPPPTPTSEPSESP